MLDTLMPVVNGDSYRADDRARRPLEPPPTIAAARWISRSGQAIGSAPPGTIAIPCQPSAWRLSTNVE
jgi:hypothetical protein